MKITFVFAVLTCVATLGRADSSIATWKNTEDAAEAASKLGHYREAEALLIRNRKFAETFPPKDARLPRTLFDLAQIYRAEGKYSEALPIYERLRQIYQDLYGPRSPELASTLDGEGELYKSLEDFEHAEPLLKQSLEMRETLPHKDYDLAQSENDLGEVYTALGQFDKAEPLLADALATRQQLSTESAETGQSLIAIGVLYEKTNRPKQAEDSYRQAASVLGKVVGGEHPDYANAMEHLALICQARKDFATAEPLLLRVLDIRKAVFGEEHNDVAVSLDDLAGLKRAENVPEEAAALYEQALALWEKIAGHDSPVLAADLNNLGAIYAESPEKEKAEPLLLRALALDEKALGPDSPDVATDLNNLGYLYFFTKRYQEAIKAFDQALTIRKKVYGDSDPLVKESENGSKMAKQELQQSAQAK